MRGTEKSVSREISYENKSMMQGQSAGGEIIKVAQMIVAHENSSQKCSSSSASELFRVYFYVSASNEVASRQWFRFVFFLRFNLQNIISPHV